MFVVYSRCHHYTVNLIWLHMTRWYQYDLLATLILVATNSIIRNWKVSCVAKRTDVPSVVDRGSEFLPNCFSVPSSNQLHHCRDTFIYRSGNTTMYTVFVSDQSPTLKVEAVFTNMLEPYPAEITQNEVKIVKFLFFHATPELSYEFFFSIAKAQYRVWHDISLQNRLPIYITSSI